MSKVNGRFYFKRSVNGNLTGEFSNNKSTGISSESAEATNTTVDFVGEYNSTWWEDRTASSAVLKISVKPGTNGSIYSVIWERNSSPVFIGEAMLCDNILIGDYRSA